MRWFQRFYHGLSFNTTNCITIAGAAKLGQLIHRLPRRRQSTVHVVPLIGPLPRLKYSSTQASTFKYGTLAEIGTQGAYKHALGTRLSKTADCLCPPSPQSQVWHSSL